MDKNYEIVENEMFGYRYKYPHPAVSTDCVIFGFDGESLKVLLVRRGGEPYKGHWAVPGGYLEINESAEAGVLRELREETGLNWLPDGGSGATEKSGRTKGYIRQLHTFSSPDRDPRERVISIAFFALVRMQEVKAADDAADARWFALDEVPALAFDHDKMLRMAMKELRRQIRFEPGEFDLLPDKFTATELQNILNLLSL